MNVSNTQGEGTEVGLSLRDVHVRFGSVMALCGANLSLPPGKVVLLVGPNGAGKTTLMSVLLGLVRPQQAELRLGGRPTRIDRAFKARLGYLPESVAFAEHATGRQVLRFFARARGVPLRRIDEVLERVGLLHAARRPVRGYSRGMRQRLGLAQALLSEPPLLILDEPTGGLDAEGLSVLWDVLETWRNAGHSVLLSSHDLGGMERRVDRLLVLRAGRTVADGSIDALRRQLALPDVLRVRLTVPSPDAERKAFLGALRRAGAASVHHEERALRCEVPPDRLLAVLAAVTARRAMVEELRVEPPSLDALYAAVLAQDEEEPIRHG